MSSNSFLHKSANPVSIFLAGAVASILVAPLLSTTGLEQARTQLAASSPSTPEVAQQVDPAGIILGLAAVGGSAAAIVLSTKKASHHSRFNTKSQEDTIRLNQASPKLQKKLLRLVHNDLDTASRLITQVKWKHPDRSINWYVEKAIYDLERDRGMY